MNGIFLAAVAVSLSLLAMWTLEYQIGKSERASHYLKRRSFLATIVLMAMILLIPVVIWFFFRTRIEFSLVGRIFFGSLLFSIAIIFFLNLFEYLAMKNAIVKPAYTEHVGADTQPYISWVASATVSRIRHKSTKAISFGVIHAQGSQSQEWDAIGREINLLAPE